MLAEVEPRFADFGLLDRQDAIRFGWCGDCKTFENAECPLSLAERQPVSAVVEFQAAPIGHAPTAVGSTVPAVIEQPVDSAVADQIVADQVAVERIVGIVEAAHFEIVAAVVATAVVATAAVGIAAVAIVAGIAVVGIAEAEGETFGKAVRLRSLLLEHKP